MSSRQQAPTGNYVCPWWPAYTFDNPVRKFFHQPLKIPGSYIEKGMKVMDVGCGMGFFSIGMAKMHVSPEAFQKTLEIAQSTGLRLCRQPAIRFSLTALFESV